MYGRGVEERGEGGLRKYSRSSRTIVSRLPGPILMSVGGSKIEARENCYLSYSRVPPHSASFAQRGGYRPHSWSRLPIGPRGSSLCLTDRTSHVVSCTIGKGKTRMGCTVYMLCYSSIFTCITRGCGVVCLSHRPSPIRFILPARAPSGQLNACGSRHLSELTAIKRERSLVVSAHCGPSEPEEKKTWRKTPRSRREGRLTTQPPHCPPVVLSLPPTLSPPLLPSSPFLFFLFSPSGEEYLSSSLKANINQLSIIRC